MFTDNVKSRSFVIAQPEVGALRQGAEDVDKDFSTARLNGLILDLASEPYRA